MCNISYFSLSLPLSSICFSLSLSFTLFLPLTLFQDGYDAKKIKKVVSGITKACEKDLLGFRPCSGNYGFFLKCGQEPVINLYGENTLWVVQNCNKVLDAIQKPELAEKFQKVIEKKSPSFPKN